MFIDEFPKTGVQAVTLGIGWSVANCALHAVQGKIEFIQPLNNFIDTSFSQPVQDAIRYQGEDFLCAPMAATLIGMQWAGVLKQDKAEKPSKTLDFINNNYNVVRSAAGLTALGAYEAIDAIQYDHPFDIKDMAAYAAGITLFLHGPNFVKNTIETVGQLMDKAANAIYPASQDLRP